MTRNDETIALDPNEQRLVRYPFADAAHADRDLVARLALIRLMDAKQELFEGSGILVAHGVVTDAAQRTAELLVRAESLSDLYVRLALPGMLKEIECELDFAAPDGPDEV